MKIGIDARLWNETGVGRYIRNLIIGIDKITASKNPHKFFIYLRKPEYESLIFKNKNIEKRLADIRWHSISEQFEFPKILDKDNLNLMHFPYFSVPVFYSKPYVVTIHDLIINEFPTGRASTLPLPIYYMKWLSYKFILRNAVIKSKKIIVPSNSVKEEISSKLKIKQEKICVTHEGVFDLDSKVVMPKTKPKNLPKQYFLKIGNVYPHKNTTRLLAAFEKFHAISPHVALVFAGKNDYFMERLRLEVGKKKIKNYIVFIDNPTDEKLLTLYSFASATIVPSLKEGFGLTALESLACSCPVLLSNIPVHREICGSAGIYFDPYDTDEMAFKMSAALSIKNESREKFSLVANEVVKKYSWQKMLAQTLSIYEDCISV